MRMKRTKGAIGVLAAIMAFSLTGALFSGFSPAPYTANAARGEFVEIGSKENELYIGGSKPFSETVLSQLYSALTGQVTLDGFENAVSVSHPLTSNDFRTKNGGKNVSVWLGGYKWDAVYATRDRSGENVILDLWISADNIPDSHAEQWANRDSDSTNTPYPASLYSTSDVRVEDLNAGGYKSSKTDRSALQAYTPQSESNEYARFTMNTAGKSLVPYLVQPAKVAYQETECAIGNSSGQYTLANDAYGTPSQVNYYNSTSLYKGKLDFTDKGKNDGHSETNYDAWKDDYVWLPSLAETGNSDEENQNGIWKTDASLRSAAAQKTAWLRSAADQYNGANWVYHLNESGGSATGTTNTSRIVRPAIHFNVSAAARASVPSREVDEIYLGDGKFDAEKLSTLYKLLTGSAETYDEVKSIVSSKSLTSADFRNQSWQNVSVTFGGIKWDAVYLTEANGRIILDLWQSPETLTLTSKFADRTTSSSNFTDPYPDNMYATSLIRVKALNAGGYYSLNNTTLSEYQPQDPSSIYAKFTMDDVADSLTKFIAKPSQVPYQETENNVYINTSDSNNYTLVNDAYGTPEKGDVQYAGCHSHTLYMDKVSDTLGANYYAAWKDDYLWLPSHSELGGGTAPTDNGIWDTSVYLRSIVTKNGISNSFTRSGWYSYAYYVWGMDDAGSSTNVRIYNEYLVRPALHLDLTAINDTFTQTLEAEWEGKIFYTSGEDMFADIKSSILGNETKITKGGGEELSVQEKIRILKVYLQGDPDNTKKVVDSGTYTFVLELTDPHYQFAGGNQTTINVTVKDAVARVEYSHGVEGFGSFDDAWDFATSLVFNTATIKLYQTETDAKGFFLRNTIISGPEYLTIDLNGQHLQFQSSDFISFDNGSTLTLTDSSGKGTGKFSGIVNVDNNGVFTMKGGTLNGRVEVSDSGSFIMENGSIDGRVSVNDSGTFTMEKGSIIGSGSYAGVYVYSGASFTMSGGSVTSAGSHVSGVHVYGGGSLIMSGGSVNGAPGVLVESNGSFTWSGGDIDEVELEGNSESTNSPYIKVPSTFTNPSKAIVIELNDVNYYDKDVPVLQWEGDDPTECFKSGHDTICYYAQVSEKKVYMGLHSLVWNGEAQWSDFTSLTFKGIRCEHCVGRNQSITATLKDNNLEDTIGITSKITVEQTCTQNGTREYTAKVGLENVGNPGLRDNLEFEFEGADFYVSVPAARLKDGNLTATTRETLPALGHAWVYSASGAALTATCSHEHKDVAQEGAQSFTITVVAPTVSTYTGTTHAATVSGSPSAEPFIGYTLTYGFSKTDLSYTDMGPGELPKAAGNYQAVIAAKDSSVKAAVAFVIGKATLTVTAKGHEITYGDGPSHNGVTYSGFVDGEKESVLDGTLTYSYDYKQYGDVGENYTITPSGYTSDNYKIHYNSGTLKVKARSVTVVITLPDRLTFNDIGDFTSAVQNLVNGDAISAKLMFSGAPNDGSVFSNSAVKPTLAGIYTVKAAALEGDKAGNYTIGNDGTQSFTIEKAAVAEPDEDNRTFTYTGTLQEYFIAANGLYSVSGNQEKDANSYTVTICLEDKNNYKWAEADNSNDLSYQFVIGKAILTVTAKGHEITYGDGPSHNGVTYSGFVNDENESVLDGKLTYSYDYKQYGDVGEDYKITPSGYTSSNYDIHFEAGTLKVKARSVTVVITLPEDLTYGDIGDFTSEVQNLVNNDLVTAKLTFNGTPNNGSDFINSAVKPTLAGIYTVKATSLEGDKAGNYTIGNDGTQSFTIQKAAVREPDEDSRTFTYTGTLQEYFIAANDLYSVSGNQEKDAKSYFVTISLKDKNNYKWAEADDSNDLSYQFVIGKASLTVTARDHEITYGDAPSHNGVTYSGFVNDENESVLDGTLTYSYTYAQFDDIGEDYKITPSGYTSSNYDIHFETGTLKVKARSVTVVITVPEDLTYGDIGDFTSEVQNLVHGDAVTAKLTFNGTPNNGSLFSNSAVKPTLAGQYSVRATSLEGDKAKNYTIGNDGTQSFTIEKAAVREPDEDSRTFTYTGVVQEYHVDEDPLYSVSGNKEKDANSYQVTISLKDKDNYKWEEADDSSDLSYQFVIGKASLTVTARDHEITYGDAPANSGVTFEGFVGEEDESVLTGSPEYGYTYARYDDVGENYKIMPSGYSSDNYDIHYAEGTLKVKAKKVTVEISIPDHLTFNNIGDFTSTVQNLVNGDVVTAKLTFNGTPNDGSPFAESDAKPTLAGQYSVRATSLEGDKAKNYTIENDGTQPFIIEKAAVREPDKDGRTFVYTGTVQEYHVDEDPLYSVSGNKEKDANSYTVTIRLTDKNNYKWAEADNSSDLSYEFVIRRSILTITARENEITYGEKPNHCDVMYEGFVNGENESVLSGNLTYSYTYDQYDDVGENYTITPRGYSSDNYDIHYNSGKLKVKARSVTVVISVPYHLTFNDIGDFTSVVQNLVNGDVVTAKLMFSGTPNDGSLFSDSAVAPTLAGSYTVKAVALEGVKAGNYTIESDGTQSFTVEKAAVAEPERDGRTFTYTGTLQEYNVDENALYSVSGNQEKDANSYQVTIHLTDSNNYKWAEADNSSDLSYDFVIGKAILTVTARDHKITYGDAPSHNGVTYSGFVNGEKESVLDGTLTYSYDYAQFDDIGESYTITPRGYTSSNYDIHFETGTLKVKAKKVTVEISIPDHLTFNDIGEFTAAVQNLVNGDVVTAKLTFNGTPNDGSLFSDSAVAPTLAGSYTVKAVALEGVKAGNYTIESDGTQSFTVEKAKVAEPTADTRKFTYNGKEQTYTVQGGDAKLFEVKDNIQRDANESGYAVTVSLIDKDNTMWQTDESTEDLQFSFIIQRAALTITARDREIIYGEAPANSGVDFKGFVNNETEQALSGTLAYVYSYAQYGDVGENYTITPRGYTSDNYDIHYENGTLRVAPREIEVAWGSHAYTYTGEGLTPPTATAVGIGEDGTFPLTVTLNDPSQTFLGAGEYLFRATLDASAAKAKNYTLKESTATHSYTVAKQTVAAPTLTSRVYNGETQTAEVAPSARYTVTENGGGINVGSYTVRLTLTDSANYRWTEGDGAELILTFAITRAVYSMEGVTLPDLTLTYDGEEHSLEIEGTLPGGVTVTYEGNGKKAVGNYTVTAIFEGDALNYEPIPSIQAVLTIFPVSHDLSGISFGDVTVTYDGSAHGITIDGALPTNVTVTYEGNGQIDPDIYTVTAVFHDPDGAFDRMTAVLTILRTHTQSEPVEESGGGSGSGSGSDSGTEVSLVSEEGFDPTLELVIEELENVSHTYWAWEKDQVSKKYAVKMCKNGVEVPFDGRVTVRLRIPQEFREKAFELMAVERGENIEYTREGDYVVFVADGLSAYVFTATYTPYFPVLIIATSVLLADIVILIVLAVILKKNRNTEVR